MPPTKGQTKAEEREAVLMEVIQCDHRVIEQNTAAMSKLMGTLDSMQGTLSLLVGQVTTSISQRNEAVPVRIVLLIVGVITLIALAGWGLNISGLLSLAKAAP